MSFIIVSTLRTKRS